MMTNDSFENSNTCEHNAAVDQVEHDRELRREVERMLCSKHHCSSQLHASGLLLVRRFEELSEAEEARRAAT